MEQQITQIFGQELLEKNQLLDQIQDKLEVDQLLPNSERLEMQTNYGIKM